MRFVQQHVLIDLGERSDETLVDVVGLFGTGFRIDKNCRFGSFKSGSSFIVFVEQQTVGDSCSNFDGLLGALDETMLLHHHEKNQNEDDERNTHANDDSVASGFVDFFGELIIRGSDEKSEVGTKLGEGRGGEAPLGTGNFVGEASGIGDGTKFRNDSVNVADSRNVRVVHEDTCAINQDAAFRGADELRDAIGWVSRSNEDNGIGTWDELLEESLKALQVDVGGCNAHEGAVVVASSRGH